MQVCFAQSVSHARFLLLFTAFHLEGSGGAKGGVKGYVARFIAGLFGPDVATTLAISARG